MMEATPVDTPRERRPALNRQPSSTRASLPRRFFAVAGRPNTYLNLAYLLLGLPLGTAYFVVLVTVIATGGGLLVTLVGLPILVAAMYGWCLLADGDRLLTNALLGARMPALPFHGETGNPAGWKRIGTRLGNPFTWRALVYLFLRFPLGIATFVAAVTLVSVSLAFLTAPAVAFAGDGIDVAQWHVDTWSGSGIQLGGWSIDTWGESLPLVPAGLILLPLSLHVLNLVAFGNRKIAELFLGSESAGGENQPPESLETVVRAAFRWQGLTVTRQLSRTAARTQLVQLRLFFVTLVVCLVVATLTAVINALTTPDLWWSLWVIWGAGIVLGMHAGYLVRGLLGAHIVLFAVVNAGLFAIDSRYSDTTWFYWPLFGWGLVIAIHLWLDFRGRRGLGPLPTIVPPQEAAIDGDAFGSPATPVAAVSIDIVMRSVRIEGVPVELTPKEFDLLALFVQNPGRPFSRDELLDRIWRNDYEVTDRTVDTHVLRLRKKLGEQAEVIQTVWGVGYKYTPPVDAPN